MQPAETTGTSPRVSVLMPTFDQAQFIRRAIASLQAQTLTDWELVIVDDGSDAATYAALESALGDPRLRYKRLDPNQGLGVALNTALGLARAPLIAYLPSDDVLYPNHLTSLVECLERRPRAILAYAGARHHLNRFARGQIEGFALQLVQVMHRRTGERWTERAELVTDDLDRMFWSKVRGAGDFAGTGSISCEWVDHPHQRHKVLQEPLGGVNPYRARYGPNEPLRFHSTVGNRIDEVAHYRRFRERPDTPPAPDALKIVLAGELAYNPERVLALEERGHKLYGLWTASPYGFNTIGPLPFGHVEDIPRSRWRETLRRIRPDVIYAQLNWQAVSFAHDVLRDNPGVPFVWHFKEAPQVCLEKGLWSKLIDLYTGCDGPIFINPETRDWFDTVVPGLSRSRPSLILDGDLPKRDWFAADRSPRRSEADGQPHTVVPGRPIGLHPWIVGEMAEQGIHLHFYGDFTHGVWHAWIEKARRLAAGYIHLHPNVDQDRWVAEFSQYDAGWLHFLPSRNEGDLHQADFNDLNYPARMTTLIAAGVPLLQRDNSGAIVASQTIVRERDLGLLCLDMAQLRAQLDDKARMAQLHDTVWRRRDEFTFDYHADRLIDFFRQVIARK